MTPPIPPLPSASVLLLRDNPLEVLMLRRHERSSFVPNAWVFPGGTVDEGDRYHAPSGEEIDLLRVCAIRELFEESGVWLGGPLTSQEAKRDLLLAGSLAFGDLWRESPPQLDQLVLTSRWITPEGVPKRFDTWFFLAVVSRDVVASVEHREAVELTWISPTDALARHGNGEMMMVFPTIRNLEAIQSFSTSAELLASRAGAEVEPVQPVLVMRNGKRTIELP